MCGTRPDPSSGCATAPHSSRPLAPLFMPGYHDTPPPDHDHRSTDRGSEAPPFQVYLDILRRGLLALERELTDPGAHPALRLVGAAASEAPDVEYDVAREHDRFLAH